MKNEKDRDIELKKEIVAICQLMALERLVVGTEGNVSGRATDGTILMTPSGYNKRDVTVEMLMRLDIEGNVISGDLTATSEKSMHLEFYKQRPKAMGVAHGHPVFATAFAASGTDLPHPVLPELVAVIGQIASVPYGRPSSEKLAHAIAPFVLKHNVFLLQNHGVTAVGRNVRDAYHRLQVAESYAKTVWAAKSLGGVQLMTEAQVADLPQPSYE